MEEFIFNTLGNVIPQLHTWHWQTTNHAAHVALGELYDDLVDLIDQITESWQGVTQTRIATKNCKRVDLIDWSDSGTTVEVLAAYLASVIDQIEALSDDHKSEAIVNRLEDIATTVSKHMYLLTLD